MEIPIDPCLLEASLLPRSISTLSPITNDNANANDSTSTSLAHGLSSSSTSSSSPLPGTSTPLEPILNGDGTLITTRRAFIQRLEAIKRKQPLQDACSLHGVVFPKSASLERLRTALVNFWYPNQHVIPRNPQQPLYSSPTACVTPSSSLPHSSSPSAPTSQPQSLQNTPLPANQHIIEDDISLVQEFDVRGGNADELLGYDPEEDESSDEDESDDEGENASQNLSTHKAFQRQVRLDATQRAERNRRIGGLKTQRAMQKGWDEFVEQAIRKQEIKDNIVDEHAMLLFIKYSAERPKRTRKGIDIPGTFIGASQLKKLFFGALRIRKEQEARDKSLRKRRPATSVTVWDAIKNRMDESLERARNGLVPNEDAPDIIANTFLADVTVNQMQAIHMAFLKHRELRSVINGHLSWVTQNASGNRGDDLRALKLAELQPGTIQHPTHATDIEALFGLQGEEKAGKRGMKTTVNPRFTAWITHLDPEMCPKGAYAFYLHHAHDVKDITNQLNIDWLRNNSWRQIRILHGPKSPHTPYSEQSHYNLYVKAFAEAGFKSNIKTHLPRHILGYRQEAMGVDSRETSKMGWVRGETYLDTYAPALPKTAILAAHGYKAHEVYDPVWCHVHVPEQFLSLMCPMAEDIYNEIVTSDNSNLKGAAKHWSMVISLRPYLFRCGAAIFQKAPESALFKLPALVHLDVRNWMKGTFPSELSALQAAAGDPVDLKRIQDYLTRQSLEEMRSLMQNSHLVISRLEQTVDRRTSVLSPTKGFSTNTYTQTASTARGGLQPSAVIYDSGCCRNCGAPYGASPSSPGPITRPSLISNPSPHGVSSQVNLHLPPPAAFTKPGQPNLLWPPVLGQRSVAWNVVFDLIQRPEMLWDVWKPSKTLDQYDLEGLWECYIAGEPVFDDAGLQIGIKPPLRLVEQYFQSKWRKGGSDRKQWERFRELPEWIDARATSEGLSPRIIIKDLDDMRGDGKRRKGLNALMKEIKELRFKNARDAQALPSTPLVPPVDPIPSASTPPAPALIHPLQQPSNEPPPSLSPPHPSSSMSDMFPEASLGAPGVLTVTNKRRAKPADPRRKLKKVKVLAS